MLAHPNFVMEVDGEFREWTADDTARVEAALDRLELGQLAARRHAHIIWVSNAGDA